MDQMFVI